MKKQFLLLFLSLLPGLLLAQTVKPDSVIRQDINNTLKGGPANPVLQSQGKLLYHELNDSKLNKGDLPQYASPFNHVDNFGSVEMDGQTLEYDSISATFGIIHWGPLSGSLGIPPPDADTTKFRIDLVVINVDGTISLLPGTAGQSAIEPAYSPMTQLVLYRIFVSDIATTINQGPNTVTFATQQETNDGILDNKAISPATLHGYVIPYVEEAIEGITGGGGSGGHVLRYNDSTLTSRPNLTVLANTDYDYYYPQPGDLRDSAAISSSVLDLRNYLSRYGTGAGKSINGLFEVSKDGMEWNTPESADDFQFGTAYYQDQTNLSYSTYGYPNGAGVLMRNFADGSPTNEPLILFGSRRERVGGVFDPTDKSVNLHFQLFSTYAQLQIGSSRSHGSSMEFRGAVYDSDYSTFFVNRSLIDKGYADSHYAITPMTTTQRDAISSPTEGRTIYNTSTHTINFFNGTVWKAVLTD